MPVSCPSAPERVVRHERELFLVRKLRRRVSSSLRPARMHELHARLRLRGEDNALVLRRLSGWSGVTEWVDHNERLAEAQERQADALEALAEQMEVQNAAILSQTHAIEQLVAVQFSGNPADAPNTASLASRVEDGVLDLSTGVDLDAVERAAREVNQS